MRSSHQKLWNQLVMDLSYQDGSSNQTTHKVTPMPMKHITWLLCWWNISLLCYVSLILKQDQLGRRSGISAFGRGVDRERHCQSGSSVASRDASWEHPSSVGVFEISPTGWSSLIWLGAFFFWCQHLVFEGPLILMNGSSPKNRREYLKEKQKCYSCFQKSK